MYALAPSYAVTLACRVAQGVSGGLIYGTASALVTQSLPRERHGRGLGVMSLGLGVGVAVGPVIGGLLVDGFGWRAVFLYRAPLALALGVVAARSPRALAPGGARRGCGGWRLPTSRGWPCCDRPCWPSSRRLRSSPCGS